MAFRTSADDRIAALKEVLKDPPKAGDTKAFLLWAREVYKHAAAIHTAAKTAVLQGAMAEED